MNRRRWGCHCHSTTGATCWRLPSPTYYLSAACSAALPLVRSLRHHRPADRPDAGMLQCQRSVLLGCYYHRRATTSCEQANRTERVARNRIRTRTRTRTRIGRLLIRGAVALVNGPSRRQTDGLTDGLTHSFTLQHYNTTTMAITSKWTDSDSTLSPLFEVARCPLTRLLRRCCSHIRRVESSSMALVV